MNIHDATSGEFTGAILSLIETITGYKRYKVVYTPEDGDFGTVTDSQYYTLKIILTKVGLKKGIGTYRIQVNEY